MPEWFADDRFWEDLFPFEFDPAAIAAGESQVDRAIALSGVERGDVLDVGCGPGRHAVALAKRGFRVTALDLSQFHLAKARELAAQAGVDVDFVEGDMRTFMRPGRFDLALSMFTSFGYFEDPRDDARVLANIAHGLKRGGTLVMDLLSKERLARVFQPTLSQQLPDGSLRVIRQQIIDDWGGTGNEWLFIKDGQAKSYRFDLRVYSGQELKILLASVGFSDLRLYGAFDGRPYDSNAERLIAVARTA